MKSRLLLLSLLITIAACGDETSTTDVVDAGQTTGATTVTTPPATTTASTESTSAPNTTAPVETTSPTTEAPTTTAGPSAADTLLGFFEAARELDGAIAAAADLFNAGFNPDEVTVDVEALEVIDALDSAPVAALIPAGLSSELETATLAVFADLDSRIAALKGAARLIVPGNLEWVLDCLDNGGDSKARFEDDYDRALALAAEEAPPTAPPDSAEAGVLAVRISAIRGMNSGCDSCGGAAYDTAIPVDWEGRVIVGGPEFEASFEGGAWQILIYAC